LVLTLLHGLCLGHLDSRVENLVVNFKMAEKRDAVVHCVFDYQASPTDAAPDDVLVSRYFHGCILQADNIGLRVKPC